MSREWAELAVNLATVYVVAGALFGVAFVTRGVARVDRAAREAGWGFRLAILPGVTALWPLLAWRWWRGAGGPPTERNAHREAAR
ncbi:MAG: hypothetical protein OES32_17115 [Acidobacteriota bacterium]|nr:hypothetical protein [Acidobacteriota bacterium]